MNLRFGDDEFILIVSKQIFVAGEEGEEGVGGGNILLFCCLEYNIYYLRRLQSHFFFSLSLSLSLIHTLPLSLCVSWLGCVWLLEFRGLGSTLNRGHEEKEEKKEEEEEVEKE